MKIAIFLFLVLLNCSTLFAYEVKVTKLTDENFDPLPKEMYVCCLTSGYAGLKQIATITLEFGFHEIGNDISAARILAKKEAAKLGADCIFFISGLKDEKGAGIISETYRCARTPDCDRDVNRILKNKELLKSSAFFKKLYKTYQTFLFYSEYLESFQPDKTLLMIGIKREQIEIRNEKTTVFKDIKTKGLLGKDEINKRWVEGYTSEVISVYKQNLDLYIYEYEKIIQIEKKYNPEFNTEKSEWPKPDAQKNINFQNFKNTTLQYTECFAEYFYQNCFYRDYD